MVLHLFCHIYCNLVNACCILNVLINKFGRLASIFKQRLDLGNIKIKIQLISINLKISHQSNERRHKYHVNAVLMLMIKVALFNLWEDEK